MKKSLEFELIIISFLFIVNILKAEEPKPLYYLGFYGGYNYNVHSADFIKLTKTNCCGENYTDGHGSGFSVGGLFDYPFNESISAGIRFGISSLNGTLKKSEVIGNAYDSSFKLTNPKGDATVSVISQTTLNSYLYLIGIEPNITFKIFNNFNTTIGLDLSYLFTGRFDQQEVIASPNYVTFVDGSLVNNFTKIRDTQIPNKNVVQVFGVLGIGYELDLSKETKLIPELRYRVPFTNISDVDWKVGSLSIGFALKLPIMPAKEKPVLKDTIYNRDTAVMVAFDIPSERIFLLDTRREHQKITTTNTIIERTIIYEKYQKQIIKNYKFETAVEATGVTRDGRRQPHPTIIIEETEVEEQFPLLPQIFFEEMSSDLNTTSMHLLTTQDVNDFQEEKLDWNTLKIYSELLNIIGYRMNKNTTAKLTISGCNANLGKESYNLKLSQERAEAIKKYLVNVWSVNENRFIINKRNLPDNPSNNQIVDGQIENRRAELSSNDFDLLKPVALKDIQRTSNPPIVEIQPSANAEAGLKSWSLQIVQGDNFIRQYKGDTSTNLLKWNVEEKPIPMFDIPVNIILKAIDKTNKESIAKTDISIQQLTIKKKRIEIKDDKRIEKFSLIVFDFDKADVKPFHKPVLNDIKERILPNSKVTIAGYADRTGDPLYNRELAQRRIIEIQKYLQVPEQNLTMEPIGSDIKLYDNDFPQGRSYSRTVQITIETPIK